jgi:hypothetical protein
MNAIANIIKTILAAIGLSCAALIALFIFAAYSGHETKIAEVACALQTDGVAEFSTCVYNATASSD